MKVIKCASVVVNLKRLTILSVAIILCLMVLAVPGCGSLDKSTFTSKDLPWNLGTEKIFYTGKVSNGTEQLQPVAVRFNLKGPWDFRVGPTDTEIRVTNVAPGETSPAIRFSETDVAVKEYTGNIGRTDCYFNDINNSQILGSEVVSPSYTTSLIEKYNPPVLAFKFPFKVGDSWESTSDIGISGALHRTGIVEVKCKVMAMNRVVVPQGKYDKCYLIQRRIRTQYDNNYGTREIGYRWVVPGIGSVADITSMNGEQNDVFNRASEFTRLKSMGTTKSNN